MIHTFYHFKGVISASEMINPEVAHVNHPIYVTQNLHVSVDYRVFR